MVWWNGEPQMIYSITDQKAQFFECTEACCGENNFYPFRKAALEEHDPGMYDLLTKISIQETNGVTNE